MEIIEEVLDEGAIRVRKSDATVRFFWSKRRQKPYESRMQTKTFQLKDDYIELNKLLKVMDLCESSGAGKALVASGVVKVNGQVELRKACKIRAGAVVTVENTAIKVLEKK